MTNKSELYNLIREGFNSISQSIGTALQQLQQDLGLADIPGWNHLLGATSIAPEPMNVQRVMVRGAYNSLQRVQQVLDGLVERELLNSDYIATDKARHLIDELLTGQRALLEALQPLADDELHRLMELLGKLTNSIAGVSLPTPSFDDMRRRTVPATMHPIEKYIRHGSYLFAFRDDSHLDAWKAYNVSGHAWEILAYIWQGDAKSPATLPENLRNARGFTEEEDEQAVLELLNRGWIAPADTDGEYKITERGKALRDKAETATDEIFYGAWNILSDEELEELEILVTRMRDELQKLIPQPEATQAR